MTAVADNDRSGVAIIGMSCRFPSVPTLADYWRILRDGVEVIQVSPPSRHGADGEVLVHAVSDLGDVGMFDAGFFGMSPKQAAVTDPQHRIFLECAWEALENSGCDPFTYAGAIGCFAGSATSGYLPFNPADGAGRPASLSDQLAVLIATDKDYLATMTSYKLNLRGPSINVQTACSTSLVAVHLACQSLLRGECDIALAGGVTVRPRSGTYRFEEGGILSRDGHTRTFDANATGTVFGNGAGIVVLKRLDDARVDRDRIRAVIRGSAINNDGSVKAGFTAPAVHAQAAVIAEALAVAGVPPDTVSYIECHGTATPLGDPIELAALREAFGAKGARGTFCAIGAVKTNLGHTECAAGVAGLIKTVLALEQRELPPTVNFERANPKLRIDDTPFYVSTRLQRWPSGPAPRRAGVSSFGIGGTNAHVVVEEAPSIVEPPPIPARAAELVVLSARSQAALVDAAHRLHRHVATHPEHGLAELAYSLATTRAHHDHRLAFAVTTRASLLAELEAIARGGGSPATAHGDMARSPGKLAWLFTGQGSQTVGMGQQLAAAWPVFRAELERACAALDAHSDVRLLDVMWAQPGSPGAARLDQTGFTQPALFALQVALAALWQSWGVSPDALAGHSIGEIAAARVAGVFSLDDAARLVAARGRLMQALPVGGAMVAIAAAESEVAIEVEPYATRVSVAAINGPRSVVISGEEPAIRTIAERFVRRGVRTTQLAVSHAFHSPLMEPMLHELRRVAASVTYRAPKLPLVSNVTGAWAGREIATADYWVNHVRAAVRFGDGIRALHDAGAGQYVEIGPRATLLGLVVPSLPEGVEPTLVASLRPDRLESQTMLAALGRYYARGGAVEWSGVFPAGMARVELPTYAWQRERYWIETSRAPAPAGRATGHPLLGVRVSIAGARAVYETVVTSTEPSWLSDHQVAGHVLVPGTGLAEMMRAAAEHRFAGEPAEVHSLVLERPLVVANGRSRRVQLVVSDEAGRSEARIYSRPLDGDADEDWTLHATADVQRSASRTPALDLSAIRGRCTTAIDVEHAYEAFARRGMGYGPAFRGMQSLASGGDEALAEVCLPAAAAGGERYGVHPALLDAAFHAIAGIAIESDGLLLPFAIDRITVHRPGASTATAYVRRQGDRTSVAFDVTLSDPRGEVLVEVAGLRLKRTRAEAVDRSDAAGAMPAAMYRLAWQAVSPGEARTAPSAGRWLVVAREGDPIADAFARRVRGAGGTCEVTTVATLAEALPAEVVVCLWRDHDEPPNRAAVRDASDGLAVIQAVTARAGAPRLVWVTFGAIALTADEEPRVAACALWGVGRTVMAEHPELACKLVDLPATSEPGSSAELVLRELGIGDDEAQVAWRDSGRHVARLIRAHDGKLPIGDNYTLERGAKGLLQQLTLVAAPRRQPGAGEVEIAIRASGLNFRDVLSALGMYPGEAGPLGGECAGIVTAVGPGVDAPAVGEAVMALAPGSFQRFVTVDARLVAPVPRGLSMEQAAAIPIAFLTAWYALHDLAKLRRGERVLVHAAAGGVGMAAVQIARAIGAEVLGTASPPKWEAVRSLGVSHVASSRDVGFAQVFRDATNGAGVEVVLNALSGQLVDASLSLLSTGGRFIEMGKTDVRDPDRVSAAHPGVVYRGFDLMDAGPSRIAEMFAAIGAELAAGRLQPLAVRTFPVTDAETAFRYMAQARHVGKLALVPPRALRHDGTVWITGGLGALGLHVARWLARRGVKHLLLTGRRGLATPGARDAIAELEALGAAVTVRAADVCDRDALAALVAELPSERPLRGIVHAAGVVDDGLVSGQTAQRFAGVMSPKVDGAWHLDQLTRSADLDLFVLFSSISGTLGAPGQAPYAAANAFLDGLASRRRAQGVVGQSLAWGPWADGGMTAALDPMHRARIARNGMSALATDEAIALLAAASDRPEPDLVVAGLDVTAIAATLGANIPSVWRALVRAPRPAAGSRGTWTNELAAIPSARRLSTVLEAVRTDVARVLSLPGPERVPEQRPLSDLGLDSLMAVELRNALGKRVGTALPATLAFDFPTCAAIATFLVEKVLKVADAPAAAAPAVHPGRDSGEAEAIAVVGIGCRYPGGVTDPESFWQLLDEGRDAVAEVPADRWAIDAWYDPDPDAPGKMTTRWGGFVSGLEGIEAFEPSFFGISAHEAATIDPRARLLLETSWEALEHAGLTMDALMGSNTGVYMGLSGGEYQARACTSAEQLDAYSLLGTMHSMMVGRLSYWLGLKGPSLPVDTACSSSLVAVHLACQALSHGDCQLALAGGANVILDPLGTVYLSRLRAMSPTGRCRVFDQAADGYVRAEGAGVVVLERLSDARQHGRRVLAVIRGSAVNQDGRSNGMTAPNGPSQESVIRGALRRAGIDGSTVGYLECHGTGTPLGDPIEVQAAAAVLAERRDRPLILGSLKSNLGHAETAAGIAGLIKTVLALHHGRIPKSLHVDVPNPHIPWATLAVKVASESIDWPRNATPRRAGVSSFGFSGTNAHAVLEEAPIESTRDPVADRAAEVIVVSAKTEAALIEVGNRLRVHPSAHRSARLVDLAHSLATTRTHHEHRAALVIRSRDELGPALDSLARGESSPRIVRGHVHNNGGQVAWLFTGQGSQRLGMGRELSAMWPVFRDALQAACAAFESRLPGSLRDIMWGADPAALDQTVWTQPALFAFEWALAALWRSWGAHPDIVCGHSIGELTAASVAGVLSLDDAARLVAARAVAMHALPPGGAMLALAISEAEATAHIAEHGARVSIAAVNGPQSVVVSGDQARIEQLAAAFERRGVRAKRLAVSHAFHSALMDPMLDAFGRVAGAGVYRRPQLTMISSVTGDVVEDAVTPDYWVRNVRDTVRFAAAVRSSHARSVTTYVELGPSTALLGSIPACLPVDSDPCLIGSMRAELSEAEAMLAALGRWHVDGRSVDWARVYPAGAARVDLPAYPWQRRRYWIDMLPDGAARGRQTPDPASPASGLDAAMFCIDWVTAAAAEGDVSRGRWLVVADAADARADALTEWLRASGATATRVDIGDPRALAGALSVDNLVCLWPVRSNQQETAALAIAEQGLALAQRLIDASPPPRCWWVTEAAVGVGGRDISAADGAVVWGLGRTLAQEYPDRTPVLVDLPRSPDAVQLLTRELSIDDDEREVSWRDGRRHAARLVRAPARSPLAAEPPFARCGRGTVLITGGLGALGMHVARALARRGAAHLVLVGRRGRDAAGAEAAIRDLEELGTLVTVAAVDASDLAAVTALVRSIPPNLPLRGVVHAAGVLDDGMLAEQSAERFARVLGPKVVGAWNLHVATADHELDFFVLFSSTAASFGGAGQAPYAAANAFLDALAARRRASGVAGHSLAWGAWADGGMAANLGAQHKARIAARGFSPLAAGFAIELFEAALVRTEPHLVLATIDLAKLRHTLGTEVPPLWRSLVRPERTAAQQAAGSWASEITARPPTERLPAVLDVVAREAARVLSLLSADAVPPTTSFPQLGLDSLMSIELRNALARRAGVALPPTLVFDHPTAQRMAEFLLATMLARSAEAAPQASSHALVSRRRAASSASMCLSFGEERLWFLHRLLPDTPLYNVEFGLRLRGPLDAAQLQRCLSILAERHDVLRTAFPALAGEPQAIVLPPRDIALATLDLRREASADAKARGVEQLRRSQRTSSFDVCGEPPWRAWLVVIDDDDHALVIAQHHMITDGWSIIALVEELARLYGAGGDPSGLPALPMSYRDHALRQRDRQAHPAHAEALAWWLDRLTGLPRLDLPIAKTTLAPSHAGDACMVALSPQLASRIKQLARARGCTLFETLLASWVAVLHRYSGQLDFPVGTVAAGRDDAEVAPLIGFFANTLLLRCNLSEAATFGEIMASLRQEVVHALEHQDVPFEEIVRRLGAPRDVDLTPLIQANFVLQTQPFPSLDVPGMAWEWLDFDRPDAGVEGTAKFNLNLVLAEARSGGLGGCIEFATDLFDRHAIERMAAHWQTLLEAAIATPDAPIATLPLMSADERARVLGDFNATHVGYADVSLLPDRIAEQARRTPDAPAVQFGGAELSYRELLASADALVGRLQRLGVEPDTVVAIMLERSTELVVAILAVLRAGGAYLPISPATPPDRIAYMLQEAECQIVVTEAEAARRLPATVRHAVVVDLAGADTGGAPLARVALEPHHLAYVIYTSGSTGKPKGVANSHAGLRNRLTWMQTTFPLDASDAVLQKTPLTFDVSVWEFLWPLAYGARLVVAPPDAHRDPGWLVDLVMRHRITTMHFVPSMLQAFVEHGGLTRCSGQLRRVFASGEALSKGLADRFLSLVDCELHNLYGPTEASIDVSWYPCRRGDDRRSVPIGRPVANTTLYVVDAHGEPTPIGVPGELLIGGAQLARGYIGRPDLTAERFVPDRFSNAAGARVYRTGDIACWTSDGQLEFLGRNDHQVKLRGFRIELGEIESALSEHAGVSAAVVVAREDRPGDKQLVAYVVPTGSNGSPSYQDLRAHLEARLPDYMVPSAIVTMSALPCSSAGKVDRRALPPPDRATRAEAVTRPRSEVERKIAELWREVLRVEQVDVTENFFETGGNSLLLVRLHKRLTEELATDVSLIELFRYPTVAAQAERCRGRAASTAPGTLHLHALLSHADLRRAARTAQELR